MSILHALVLGVAQGLSEFLPISSSAHLELIPWLFGWDDFGGDPVLENSFDVALHLGTLVGAVAFLWSDVTRYAAAGIGQVVRRERLDTDGRIAWFLVLSAVPAAFTGLLLEDVLLASSDNIWLIAVMLIVFGVVLWAADRSAPEKRGRDDFGWRDALLMGAGQALALQPGVSRSGVTMTVARFLRFDREATARLAFLMSLPIIAGAGVFRFGDMLGDGGIPTDMRAGLAVGVLASAVTGWFAVWGMLRFVRTRTFAAFVVYRCALGAGVLLLLATSFR